ASYILAVGRLREEFSTATILAWSATSSALLLWPVCAALGEPFLPATATGWAVLVGLALVSHVGGQGLIAYALAHLPAAFSSVTLLVQPAMATLLAWVFFDERLGAWQAAGAVVIVVGILLARRGSLSAAAAA
ncbi:MAG: EamA family transporter, partial [Planctomycetota bacterium]